jgi:hypothetical protein
LTSSIVKYWREAYVIAFPRKPWEFHRCILRSPLNSGDHAAAEADGDSVCAGAGLYSPVDVADMHLDRLL